VRSFRGRIDVDRPHVVVLSGLFPSARQPGAGLFIRERMFRVARQLPLAVVAPSPWFPFQGLLRRWRKGFRAGAPRYESQQGIDVWYPRYFSFPGVLKQFDGVFMALGALPRLWRLRRMGRLDIIDAHFAYPDGYAASLVGRWLGVPVTITLRGTEPRHARDPALAPRLRAALHAAARVFAVSTSLRNEALRMGAEATKVLVVGNGVDLDKFRPVPREEARRAIGLSEQGPVLITVGALVERKGFHSVIDLLPTLREQWPGIRYLIVGGSSPEGDITEALRAQVRELALEDAVRFVGQVAPDALHCVLSAADLFVLATSNEGWANVLLEAMACRLPVVTTDVGGNAEVVADPALGAVVPFGDRAALLEAIRTTLSTPRDGDTIRAHAERNTWDQRVVTLVGALQEVAMLTRSPVAQAQVAP
jgi:glycosyltransferase involved in cell wall biosynthesis